MIYDIPSNKTPQKNKQLAYLKNIKIDITRKLAKLSTCLEITKQHTK